MVEILKKISGVNINEKNVVLSVRRIDLPLGERISLTIAEWKDIGSPLPGQTLKFTVEEIPDV